MTGGQLHGALMRDCVLVERSLRMCWTWNLENYVYTERHDTLALFASTLISFFFFNLFAFNFSIFNLSLGFSILSHSEPGGMGSVKIK